MIVQIILWMVAANLAIGLITTACMMVSANKKVDEVSSRI